MNLLVPVLGESQRERALINLRGLVVDSQYRFFLALLLNIDDRTLILDLVKQRFPDRDPIDCVCNWVKELSNMDDNGATGTNILGVEGFSNLHLQVFRHLLQGISIEELHGMVGKAPVLNDVAVHVGEIEKVSESFQRSILLKSVLCDSPLIPRNERPLNTVIT